MKKIVISLFASLMLMTPSVYAAKYKVTTFSNGGSISGFATLKGTPPKDERFAVAKNPEVCGTEDRMIKWVEVGENKGLKNMIVYLHKIKEGKDWSAEEKKKTAEIDQKNCTFTPWLKAVPKGTKLKVKNSDPVLHNIHIRQLVKVRPNRSYRPIKRTLNNEGQPPGQGDIFAEIKSRMRGNFIQINCEAHNFMFAWMFAADNPYYVQTGEDGSYSIENIPPGKYKLRAWHPTLGLKEIKGFEVRAGGKMTKNFLFKSK